MLQKNAEPKTPWQELLPDDDIDLPILDLDGNGESTKTPIKGHEGGRKKRKAKKTDL